MLICFCCQGWKVGLIQQYYNLIYKLTRKLLFTSQDTIAFIHYQIDSTVQFWFNSTLNIRLLYNHRAPDQVSSTILYDYNAQKMSFWCSCFGARTQANPLTYFQIHFLHFATNVCVWSDAGDPTSRLGHHLHASLEGICSHHCMDCCNLRNIQETRLKRTLNQDKNILCKNFWTLVTDFKPNVGGQSKVII